MTERAEYTSQRERLKEAVAAPEVVSLSHGRTTPLTLSRLRMEVPQHFIRLSGEDGTPGSPDFFDCGEVFDWPDATDRVRDRTEEDSTDSGFTYGVREYDSDEDFARHLTYASSRMDYPEKGLNNFLVPFTSREEFNFGDAPEDHDPLQMAMVTEPHFMRLKAIAPEFVSALRGSVHNHLKTGIPITDDPLLVEGLHRAYRIMGRLVKRDDVARHAHFLGFSGIEGQPIDDIHHALAS